MRCGIRRILIMNLNIHRLLGLGTGRFLHLLLKSRSHWILHIGVRPLPLIRSSHNVPPLFYEGYSRMCPPNILGNFSKCWTGLSRVSLLSFQKYLHSETKTIIDCHVIIVLVQESLWNEWKTLLIWGMVKSCPDPYLSHGRSFTFLSKWWQFWINLLILKYKFCL